MKKNMIHIYISYGRILYDINEWIVILFYALNKFKIAFTEIIIFLHKITIFLHT